MLEANHSIQPAIKLVPLPKPILAKLYAPPAFGIAELSSAKDIAVKNAMSPLSAKVSSNPPGPARCRVFPIPMKTPAPIIIPNPIIVMWKRVRSRESSGVTWELSLKRVIPFEIPCVWEPALSKLVDSVSAPDRKQCYYA